MDALPIVDDSAALAGDTPIASPAGPAAPAIPSERDIARAAALLMEGLLTENEFGALTGMTPEDLPTLLADSTKLAEVKRMSLELQNTGALARLEALRHARGAVEIAAGMMRDPDMHAGVRLNAAVYIAKVAGTEKAPAEEKKPMAIRININFGTKEPQKLVVEGTAEKREWKDSD